MNFETYCSIHSCVPLEKTEQSWTFTTTKDQKTIVVKKYPYIFDKLREELAYAYISAKDLLKIPKILGGGEDFMEMELIESTSSPTIKEIVEGISEMYTQSLNDSKPKQYFPKLDLTVSKIIHRLDYIPLELEKRGFLEKELIDQSHIFLERRYVYPQDYCLVHRDLKSPHTIKNDKGLYFIDLALVSVANPWYDLALLYMERKGKQEGLLEELISSSFENFGTNFSVTKQEIEQLLISSIFYRQIYDVGFAARHRKENTLIRTIKDLKETLQH